MKLCFFLLSCAALLPLLADTSRSPYGVCAHICKGEQWKLAEPKFRVMKPAGIRWVRNGFTWEQAEPKQGVWDYSKLDIVAETAKRYQIDILPILAYDVPWGHPVSKHLELWREYVRRTVSRYGKQFRFWEIWNEPNIHERPGSKIDPEQYVQILRAAQEEIKKIDPDLQVVFGGTAGVPIPYIEACLKAGGANYFDVMNIHPYIQRGLPEKMKDLIDPLFALFRKYNVKKPVWVTEFSWPTHRFPPVMTPEVLREALKHFHLTPETAGIAVIRNPDLENERGKIFAPNDYTLGVFPKRKEISYADLKNLDVRRYPLLVPSLTQAFPREYFADVVDYVKRGGVILHSCGLPFYCDAKKNAEGLWRQVPDPQESMMKALHIQWLAGWKDNVPKSGSIQAAPGLKLPAIRFRGSERYLSDGNLKKGDRLIPLYLQKNKEFCAPVVGVYRFDSDLKGGVIADVNFPISGVSQEVQGQYLPRAYLTLLSRGIERIFWYKFRAEEYDPTCNGHHFGIVHRDYSPRDAFTAYRFLIRMCPEGSTRPEMTREGRLCHARWKRPDGVVVHAWWTTEGEQSVRLPFAAREIYDYLGRKQPLRKTVTASGGILYATEP